MSTSQDPDSPESPSVSAAKRFGNSLDSVFGMSQPIAELSHSVEEKKREVDSQADELAALDRRLKEAEARLASMTGTSTTAPGTSAGDAATSGASAPSQVADGMQHPVMPSETSMPTQAQVLARPAAGSDDKPPIGSRQDSSMGLAAKVPGAMPITPPATDL